MIEPNSKLKIRGNTVHGLRTGGLLLAGCLAGRAMAISVGAPVTIGAAADNSTIKMTFGSFSSVPSAANPAATWGVAYITPASDWSTSGAVNVSFQVFNPGPTYLTSGAPKIKAVDGLQFNMQSTAVVVAQQYPASAGQTLSSSIAGSVTIPALSPLSPVTLTTTDAASSFGEYAGSYNVNAGSPGNFNYQVLPATDLNATTSGAGGDIMNWRIAPTVAGAAAGDRIYVSDFYKTSVSGVYAGFHIIGINGASSFVGAQAANIIYTTPEPGTWAAIVGLGAAFGWQVYSRRRSATATATVTVTR